MSGEKTEQPTPKRLRDSREKGDIAKSTEIVSFAVVAIIIFYFVINAKNIFSELVAVTSTVFTKAPVMPFSEALELLGGLVVSTAVTIVAPIVMAVICAALLSLLAQTGMLFAPKAAMPKLENLSPKKWVKKVFSLKNVFEFFKNIIKVFTLAVAIYLAAHDNSRELFKVTSGNIGSVLLILGQMLRDLATYTIVAFAVLAALDFLYTKYKYTKDHMMSMDEVKREYKEMEGDPQIKQKRKQLHQEMINQNTLAKTRKAKVLIVNPTHYAVAVDYEPGRTELPVVLAKGQGDLAKRMIEIAKEEHIPVMRQPPLARALYAEGNEDEYVPRDLLIQVAEILKIVSKLNNGD
ncbi:MAG: type III secretion system export apparatus subunit SctU [Succinivibrio sp.]